MGPRAAARVLPGLGGAVHNRALVVVLVALAATSSGVAEAATPPRLSATVVVTGSRHAYTEVTLDRTLKIPMGTSPDAAIAGKGFVALALIRVQRGETPPGLVLTTVPGTATPHHAWIGHARGTHADDDPPTYFTRTLPAGRYRLYLFTSGQATVTWRLPLRGGRTTVSPRSRTTAARTESVAPGERGTVVASAYAHQLTAAVENRGLMLGLTWYEAHAHAVATLGNCTYPGQPAAVGLGPAPACLNRDVSIGRLGPATDDGYVSQGSGYLEPGTWTSKHYVRVAGTVRDGGVSVLVADLGAGFPAH